MKIFVNTLEYKFTLIYDSMSYPLHKSVVYIYHKICHRKYEIHLILLCLD